MISSPSCSLGKISRMTDKILEDAMVFNYILNTIGTHNLKLLFCSPQSNHFGNPGKWKIMFSQVNDDFEDSPRTPTTQRSITQRPGDSSGPGDNHVLFDQNRCIPRSFDIPRSPTHVMEDRKRSKAKADRDQPPEEHNTGAAKNTGNSLYIMKPTFALFQTVTEGAPVQVRKYQIERRIFQVASFLKPW